MQRCLLGREIILLKTWNRCKMWVYRGVWVIWWIFLVEISRFWTTVAALGNKKPAWISYFVKNLRILPTKLNQLLIKCDYLKTSSLKSIQISLLFSCKDFWMQNRITRILTRPSIVSFITSHTSFCALYSTQTSRKPSRCFQGCTFTKRWASYKVAHHFSPLISGSTTLGPSLMTELPKLNYFWPWSVWSWIWRQWKILTRQEMPSLKSSTIKQT